MIKFTFFITNQIRDMLRKIALRKNVSVAYLVRCAIEDYLKKEKNETHI